MPGMNDKLNSARIGREEIPYADFDRTIAPYGCRTMKIYTADETARAGVPAGSSGYVIELTGSGGTGLMLDFSDRGVNVSAIEGLFMRVWYSEGTKEVRLSNTGGSGWLLRHPAKPEGGWEDILVTDGVTLEKLFGATSRCPARFGLAFRYLDSIEHAAYIDEVSLRLKASDNLPPVITYTGPAEIRTTEGKPFTVNATAYDEYEKAYFPVLPVWPEGALDENGLMQKGTYSVILRTQDSFGNASELPLRVIVGNKDTEPPVIHFPASEIHTFPGTKPQLEITATDNEDEVTVVQDWSEGAIDASGRLCPGTHTLTLSSQDLTGNKTVKTVRIICGGSI